MRIESESNNLLPSAIDQNQIRRLAITETDGQKQQSQKSQKAAAVNLSLSVAYIDDSNAVQQSDSGFAGNVFFQIPLSQDLDLDHEQQNNNNLPDSLKGNYGPRAAFMEFFKFATSLQGLDGQIVDYYA